MMKLFHLIVLSLLVFPGFSQAQESDVDAKMQKMAAQLAERIRTTGKHRVGVADFNDLQSNIPELGKFLAENLQGELVNNQLRVINRQRIEQLLIENKLTAQKLLDPDNALTLGKAAGMEVIVTGTITPLDDKVLVLNVLALDVQGAVAIAGAKTFISRTPSINLLLRTVVGQASGPSSVLDLPTRKASEYEEDMPKNRCENGGWGYGTVYFSNRFNEPLLLYKVTHPNGSSGTPDVNVLISPGAESCSPLILTASEPFRETTFHFQTTGPIVQEGFVTLPVGRCKARHVALTPSNFHFIKAKNNR